MAVQATGALTQVVCYLRYMFMSGARSTRYDMMNKLLLTACSTWVIEAQSEVQTDTQLGRGSGTCRFSAFAEV